MDIELLKKLKKLQKLTNEELSEKSGVPVGTVNKILSGATKSPRHDTIEALAEALNYHPYETERTDVEALRESLAYGTPRNYTLQDYYDLPEDVRAELINGSFFFMETPTLMHQTILGELFFQIKKYIKEKGGKCKVFLSPFDVRLDNDDKTIVQPDLMIICDMNKLDEKRYNGAPDYVAEIVSKSSSRLDYIKKLNKYLDAGVKEYWIIDPDKQKVTVYQFHKEDAPQYYSFTDKVPIGLYKDLSIDFSDILNDL
ncbi:Uma2 family endonuclease [Lachnospiraceae bacterium MD1]|uniref:Uma2 family endonuclease n=1 Tax=Variimorphobacter saccharofermentans TaxID=2755051 RepID=A0A839JVK3_9FIRM|nr:Uma2 family endonuclease [Variimorphobacter saccharofermentans]MBB2181304.1 Uma2 family endonuclease [Variimorphobacter saccharofermentans]